MRRGGLRGAALLLVLGCVAILSLAVASVIGLVAWEQEEAIVQGGMLQARARAEAGLAIGMHPKLVEPWDPLLSREFEDGSSYEVTIGSDNSRLAINALLQQGQDLVLERLFRTWGLSEEQARRLVDHLADWVDGDGIRRLNGGEWDAYQALGFRNMPLNRRFQTLNEMSWVLGMKELEKLRPDWRDSFTVWGDGKVNVNDASFETLRALAELEDSDEERLASFRRGFDQKEGTEDDGVFKSLDEFRRLFGISLGRFEEIEPFLTLDKGLRRVTSVGRAGRAECRIEVVGNPETGVTGWRLWVEK